MRMRPVRLNTAMAVLFAIGSACFVIGSVPAFVTAVGGVADSVTYVVGSLFFTSASLLQLLQAQSPTMTDVDAVSQHTVGRVRIWRWLPHDRGWLAAAVQFPGTVFFNISTIAALTHNTSVQAEDRYVWRPDVYGSTLFLIASVFGILAIGRFWSVRPRSMPWRIAWLNMIGSILFMASALASYVVPGSGDLLGPRVTVAGTLLGAVCFLIGSVWLIPAWRRAVSDRSSAEGHAPTSDHTDSDHPDSDHPVMTSRHPRGSTKENT